MTKKFRIMGCNDDFDTCDCCGKTGLKRVVMLAPVDPDGNLEGDPSPYGTSCAAKLLGYAYPKDPKERRWAHKTIEQEALRLEVKKLQDYYAQIAASFPKDARVERGTNRFGVAVASITINGEQRRVIDKDDHDQPLSDEEVRRRVAKIHAENMTYLKSVEAGSLASDIRAGFRAATGTFLYARSY